MSSLPECEALNCFTRKALAALWNNDLLCDPLACKKKKKIKKSTPLVIQLGEGWMTAAYQHNAMNPHLQPNYCCQKVQLWQLLSRCRRQRCEESWHGLVFPMKATSSSQPFNFSHCINHQYLLFQSVYPFLSLVFVSLSPSFLSFFQSLFLPPSYLFVLSPASLLQLRASDYTPLNSPHKYLLVSFYIVYSGFWLNIQWCVCMCVYFSVHHQPRHDDKIISLEMISLFFLFDSSLTIAQVNPQLCDELIRCVCEFRTRLLCGPGLWLFSRLALKQEWGTG